MNEEMMYRAWKNRGNHEVKYQPLLPSGESAWRWTGGIVWEKEDRNLEPVLCASGQDAHNRAYNYLCSQWEPLT